MIGIDLGTTNTRVIAQRNALPQLVINESGGYETPTAIVVDQTDGLLVGGVVRSRFISHPAQTIVPFRQLLGRRLDAIDTSELHYDIAADDEGMPLVEVDGRRHQPVSLCAALLRRLAKDAVIRSDAAAQSVVLTMPPGADAQYRAALRQAVADAGLSLKVFIEDPIAAVLGCGMDDTPGSLIAVYDFGGHSFSISIVSMERTGPRIRASETLSSVGCVNIDRAMAQWLMSAYRKKRKIDLSETPLAYRRLLQETERVRVMLSRLYETPLVLPFAVDGEKKAHLATRVKRMQLERFTDAVLRQTLPPCQRVFAAAGIQTSDLSEVLVVGGPGRMPRLHEFVRTVFGRTIPITIAPLEAIAEGAWLSGAFLTGAVDPSKARPRKGVLLSEHPTRELNKLVERMRDGPDPTAVPSPKLKLPARATPPPEPVASQEDEAPYAFQLNGDEGDEEEDTYSSFSFIEITDEELAVENPLENERLGSDQPTDDGADHEPAPPASEPEEAPLAPSPTAPRSRGSQLILAVVVAAALIGLGLLGLLGSG